MFSAENNIKYNKLVVHGGGYWDWEEGFGGVMSSTTQVQGGYDSCSLGSADHQRLMAEEQSSMNEAAGSSSKDHVQQQEDEGWLQLSIGTAGYTNHKKLDQSDHQSSLNAAAPRPVELELLPSSTSSGSTSQIFRPLTATVAPPPPPPRLPVMNYSTAADHGALFFLQHPTGTSTTSTFPNYHHQDQIINWAYRPIPINITPPSTSSSSTPLIMGPASSYFPRPFQVHTPATTPSPDFRVIQPPRRPHSGIWFVLQASQNQAKEPFLPQISKSYLRIKDGRMTIGLVKKYLVNKLSLEDESEIEITCKGQELLPFLTLQHVRDNIWSQRDFVTLLPNSSSATDHIMVLFYGRSASN